MLTTVGVRGGAALVHGQRLHGVALRFLRKVGLRGVELSLSLVSDAAIQATNRDWRGKDKPTDVLSFPAGDSPGPGLEPLGDVVLSWDTARRVAKQEGVSVERELDRYLAHGLLHLLGHDHHRAADARRMAQAEAALLGRGGMLSPRDE